MQATTAVDSKPHRPIKAKLAVLTALLSLVATAQAFTAAPVAAMDDNGPQCTLSIVGGVPVMLDANGQICDLSGGEEGLPEGDVYYVEDTKPKAKTEPPPNPRADGCYFGCLKKDTRRPQGREGLVGFPDKPRGPSAGKAEKPQKSKRALHTKGECLESAHAEENLDVIDRMRELWKRKNFGSLLSREASLTSTIPDLNKKAEKMAIQLDAIRGNGVVDVESEKGKKIAELETQLSNLDTRLTSLENELREVSQELSTVRAIHSAIKNGMSGDDVWTAEECLKVLFADEGKSANPAKAKR